MTRETQKIEGRLSIGLSGIFSKNAAGILLLVDLQPRPREHKK